MPDHKLLLPFSAALESLKRGAPMMRHGWNGKGMYVFLVSNWSSNHVQLPHLPFLAMKTADNKVVPWLASQTDMLAEDWERV